MVLEYFCETLYLKSFNLQLIYYLLYYHLYIEFFKKVNQDYISIRLFYSDTALYMLQLNIHLNCAFHTCTKLKLFKYLNTIIYKEKKDHRIYNTYAYIFLNLFFIYCTETSLVAVSWHSLSLSRSLFISPPLQLHHMRLVATYEETIIR